MAHDFNNILNGIISYASLLQDKIPNETKPQRYLSNILSASKRASNIVANLLGFARKGTYELKPSNLNAAILEAHSIFESSLKKNINVTMHLQEDLLISECDSTQILQVIINLVLNANDAMPQGGEIQISSKNVKLEKNSLRLDRGEYVQITVEDNGEGIPEDKINRIFDPFYTTKEKGKGTGLGLAMVFGIIKNHNGSIEVKSKEGQGTSFIIYLPSLNQKQDLSLNKLSHKKILVVDDESMNIDIILDSLSSSGAEFLSCSNAADGLKILKNNSGIDLAILDVIMPDEDGISLYNKISKITPGLKVLFMSGFNENYQLMDLLKNNQETSFIRKPFSKESLITKINQLC